tara:strand:+ start:255 stop:632 length:378 start_codon:yes stop_codon:yes gene_type:complete
MNQDLINIIGRKEASRKEAIQLSLIDVEGLIEIFDKDFLHWSDFDSWENLGLQQWIFARAMEVYLGKKVDIKCDCCEYIYNSLDDLENSIDKKCYGLKSAYMIGKILDEIVLAKARRGSDGTYSA